MKIHAYQVLVSLVLIISVLVIALRGVSPQPVVYQTDTLQDATSIQGIGRGAQLWADNFTNDENWPLTVPSTATASLQLNGSLVLNVGFTSQATAQAVSVSHNINIDLD